ncbi:MAG: nitrous oxide reductase accessory protein NosL, partial [Gammaproteobacteria bacterium]|nr:nitrous oxide reductase accessory protein NosL [Gammaproteobacteria bacterium]
MKHRLIKLFALALLSTQLLSGCSEPTTGAVEVHWDRDNCERCRMVLSDHQHAAQIRFVNEKQKSVVYKFDDVGCAVIWLEDKPWRDTNSTEIWVTDYTDGKWIDAKTAYYV